MRLLREAQDAAAQLGASHALLDALFERSPIGLKVLDRNARYLRVNERLAELHGIPIERHLGRTVVEVVPSKWAGGLAEAFERALRGDPVELELAFDLHARPG